MNNKKLKKRDEIIVRNSEKESRKGLEKTGEEVTQVTRGREGLRSE